MNVWANVAVVILFILLGGVFAASEMALVSLRDSQVRALSVAGGAGPTVRKLTGDPNRFLSAVQVGVTLAGFFSASFGAAELAPVLVPTLTRVGLAEGTAFAVALVLTTVAIAYLSLVLGELVPKRLAMQAADRFALVVARPLDVLAGLLRPVIWLLSVSTDAIVRALGRDPHKQREEMGAEELRSLVAEHESLTSTERDLLVDVLAIGARTVQEVMTPRTEVTFLPAAMSVDDARKLVTTLEFSRYPVSGTDSDDVLGFVHIRDLIDPPESVRTVRDLTRDIPFLPGGKPVLAALTELQAGSVHVAVVVDEYGGTDGIVTIEDVVEEFVGQIRDEYDREDPTWADVGGARFIPGLLGRADTAKALGEALPEGPFDTLGGFVMYRLGRVPAVGDEVAWEPFQLQVAQLDGLRVDRLEVRREPVGEFGPSADDGQSRGLSPGGSASAPRAELRRGRSPKRRANGDGARRR
ncbi:MAG TPA: hemolysin family protein [Dermatophilaceae bacterium]|nr:hemolysin family protein [Dermatophilaceae bacterium]